MKVPKYLFLRLCQATAEAVNAMATECADGLTTGGIVKLEGDAHYMDVSDVVAEAMRTLIAHHPEEQVRDYYLNEIERMVGDEE